MSKPVLSKITPRKKRAIESAALDKRRVVGEDGRVQTVYRLDAASGRFDVEFSKAFRLSVAKARRDNKRLTGSPDVGRAKK